MPKVDIYGAQLFVMTRTAHLEHDHIAYVETAIFVRTNFIISARHGRIAIFARNSSGTGPYKVAFGDWETVALPPYSKDSAMRKRYPAQEKSLEERLAEHATRLREEAKALPPGTAREAVLKRTVADMTELCRPRLKSNA